MGNLRWQLFIAFGGLLLVIGLLVGQVPNAATTSPQPVHGGVYVEALVGELGRLNPILDFNNSLDRDIDRLIYSGLVRFDERGVPQADLAEWAVTADARLYTFTLFEEIFWHDGEPVTSDDVVYTYSKLQDSNYPGPKDLQSFWQEVNIIRLDSRRIQFQLPEPFAPFLDYLSLGLLPDHLLRGVSAGDLIDHPFNLHPIGTGPFRFDRFLIEEGQIIGVSLAVYDDYHENRPFLERIEFLFFEDSQSTFEAYSAGEVQGISDIEIEIFPQVLESLNLNLHTARLPRLTIVYLNTKHSEKTYLSEKSFRQALMLSLNRQWIINQALQGQALIPLGPILPATWSHSESLTPIPFEPSSAADLLDTLDWELPTGASPGTDEFIRSKDDQVLSLELMHPNNEIHTQVAIMIKTSWEAIGIKVNLVSVDSDLLLKDYLEPREYDAVLIDLNLMRYPDPDPYPFWHDSQAETGQNYSGFTDRNISIWLEQARITPDFGRRADSYRSFQHRFQDQLPALLLYYSVYNYAIDAAVQGVSIGPLIDSSDRFNTIVKWHLLARRGVNLQPTVKATP